MSAASDAREDVLGDPGDEFFRAEDLEVSLVLSMGHLRAVDHRI